VQQTISDRIGLGPGTYLVHEAFVGEGVLNSQWRAKRAGKERRSNGMGQCAFTGHRSFRSAAAVDAACEILGDNVALIAKLSFWRFRWGRLRLFGFVAQ